MVYIHRQIYNVTYSEVLCLMRKFTRLFSYYHPVDVTASGVGAAPVALM